MRLGQAVVKFLRAAWRAFAEDVKRQPTEEQWLNEQW